MVASPPLRIAIAGPNGKMGRALVAAVAADPSVVIEALLGRTFASTELADCDCLIDFTRPEATLAHLDACVARHCNLVIGTTGMSPSELERIHQATTDIAIVLAPNMSLGVSVAMKLVELAARSLGMDADVEIFDAHHRLKVDAPSGTALKLGTIVAEARGQTLASAAVYERHGVSGERPAGAIGFSVVRAGDIVGDHTVTFALAGERIEITHRAASRETYATGAIRAAKFLSDRRSGLFDMHDVLGLK